MLVLPDACCEPAYAMDRLTVDFDLVTERARQLAESPYEEVRADIPDVLRTLDYNAYLQIRSDPGKALWAEENLPFRIAFSLPGYIFDYAVKIDEFTATHVQAVPFATHFFDFGNQSELADKIPPSLGYAGFHVFYHLNEIDRLDEFAVFLGSSYFRVVGRGGRYGISARGLAINTTAAAKEEFPVFREFWLGKPQADAEVLTIYALLDGPSVTGAYRFELAPGHATVVRVRTCLFFRKTVEQAGIAPFSSMFYFNENSVTRPPDYRPQVHDSDGLLIRRPDDTYMWRPLINPSGRMVSVFPFDRPPAFGLCQRERKFTHYQDIDQHYQQRPSVWIEPGKGDWGPGAVVLYTFGADSETDDNVVAFWEPNSTPAGAPLSLEYTLTYSAEEHSPAGHVTGTRVGGPVSRADLYQYVVDFDGKDLRKLEAIDRLEAVANAGSGIQLEKPIVIKNPFDGTWRLILQFSLTDKTLQEAELTAFLTHKGQRVTETWNYVWTKERQFPPTLQRIYGTRPTGE
jgi:glucans biosynthesis protein